MAQYHYSQDPTYRAPDPMGPGRGVAMGILASVLLWVSILYLFL